MRILVSFPGKHGDVIWALPAIRALSRRIGEPVDLMVAAPYASICPLIEQQDYIGTCWAESAWAVQDTAPMTPRTPPGVPIQWDAIFHLGYRDWPKRPLPFETLDCLNAQSAQQFGRISDAELALDEPWITVEPWSVPNTIIEGFTDEHFELKYGLSWLLSKAFPIRDIAMPGSRWAVEGEVSTSDSWEHSARLIGSARLFFGCCSALHVLAVALGKPVVLMEPNPHRHADIFYPYGKTGPRVTLVLGNDGLPSFDARHVRDEVKRVLGV